MQNKFVNWALVSQGLRHLAIKGGELPLLEKDKPSENECRQVPKKEFGLIDVLEIEKRDRFQMQRQMRQMQRDRDRQMREIMREMQQRFRNEAGKLEEYLEIRNVISYEPMKNAELLKWLDQSFPKSFFIESNRSSEDNYTMFGQSKGDFTIFKLSEAEENMHGALICTSEADEQVSEADEEVSEADEEVSEVDEQISEVKVIGSAIESQMIADMFMSAAHIAKKHAVKGRICDVFIMHGLHIICTTNEATIYKMTIDFNKGTPVEINKTQRTNTVNEALSYLRNIIV